ncbi:MAG TPA: outer membrane beta-barrel protein [Vicinamibacterales bacterium]
MKGRRIRATAAAGAAWALLTAGVACAGQDPVPPGTVILGPLRLTPSVIVKDMGIDDNVFNESVSPKRDFTFTVTPRADIVFRMRRVRLTYATVTDYVYFRKYTTERGTNASSSARLDFDLGLLKPYATITGLNTRARLNTEVDTRARHQDLVYGAGVALKIGSRTNLLLNGSQGKVVYESGAEFRGVDLRESFNGRRRAVDAGLGIALTPLTTFTMIVAREQQRFERSPERDSNAWRISPTFSFSPTGLLTGSASVGYRRFHTLSPTLPDYSGLVSAVAVGATIYGRNLVQGVFNRDVQYSYDLTTDYYVGTGGTLTWTLSVVGPIDVRGVAARFLMDYRGEGGREQAGRDQTTSYGGGIGYRFGQRARLGVNVDWSRRESNRSADRAYRNHRIFAGLTWGATL